MNKSQQLQGLCVCYEGVEDIVAQEIKEILGVVADIHRGAVIFPITKREQLFTLAYKGQSFSQVIELIGEGVQSESLDTDALSRFDFSALAGKRFRATCVRIGEHDFCSRDLEDELGGVVLEKVSATVDLHTPEIILFAYIYHDHFYLGFDYSGLDLSKREYNVYPNTHSIKGPLAYTLLQIANYRKDKVIVDPFCLSGTIPIEAAFFASGFSINYFRKKKFIFVRAALVDEFFFRDLDTEIPQEFIKIYGFDYNFPNVTAAKHNAKLGGVEKVLDFRRGDTRWIDLKFDDKTVDCIVTAPPRPTGRTRIPLQKRMDELFQNAREVLKKDGLLVIIDNGLVSALAEKYAFVLRAQRTIKKGKMQVQIMSYGLAALSS